MSDICGMECRSASAIRNWSRPVLRQASRRSWRIGQKQPVRVGFLTYANTAQESCLRLMGKKLLVSLALEGKLQGDGLQFMDDDDDLLTAMARELVTRQGVGERAAEVWKSLQIERGEGAEPCNNGAEPRLESGATHEAEFDTQRPLIDSGSSAVQLSLF